MTLQEITTRKEDQTFDCKSTINNNNRAKTIIEMNEIIIQIATVIIAALIGTYGGAFFLGKHKEVKIEKVRAIALKALMVLRKYSKQFFRNAENDFNTSLSLVEKRTILVALHK